jgi:prepilin-type N-terminal cleavage/methylation domain-containing protein
MILYLPNNNYIFNPPRQKTGFTLIEVVIALAIFGMLIGGLLGFLPWGVDGVKSVKGRGTANSLVDAVQIELERLGFSYVEEATKRLDGLYSSNGITKDAAELHELCLVAPIRGRIVSTEGVRLREQKKISQTGEIIISTDENKADYLNSSMKDMGGVIKFNRYDDKPISISTEGNEKWNDNQFDSYYAGNRWIAEKDRYFLIICRQFAKYPNGESLPASKHAHDVSNGHLALKIEVQWPYKLPSPVASAPDRFSVVAERFRSKFTFPLAISR